MGEHDENVTTPRLEIFFSFFLLGGVSNLGRWPSRSTWPTARMAGKLGYACFFGQKSCGRVQNCVNDATVRQRSGRTCFFCPSRPSGAFRVVGPWLPTCDFEP